MVTNLIRKKPRLIAFYLPQYHPIPENDEWWGKGFTEWTNVAKAKPLFKGHYQPHLPADLGFYDLRVPEVREEQAQLARDAGIYGFCYYHYWFNGKKLLERPFQEVLESGKPDFPFCLCWANENWTRRWDGQESEILMEMKYSPEDDRIHIQALLPAFTDERYIKVDGKPLVLIYRASNLPDPISTTSIWREEAKRFGFQDLYICKVESLPRDQTDPTPDGFDASVEFQPDWKLFKMPVSRWSYKRILKKLKLIQSIHNPNHVIKYQSLVERTLAKQKPIYLRYPCVTPSWDNTSRRKSGYHVLTNANPKDYENWLIKVLEENVNKEFVFINAWNEWAEGNHLEPDQRFGNVYLLATQSAIEKASKTILERENES